jgi:hypothetical protein
MIIWFVLKNEGCFSLFAVTLRITNIIRLQLMDLRKGSKI